jgi:hypothetical protein
VGVTLHRSSMVVDDFDIHCFRLSVRPLETDPPLVIDADAELPRPVTSKRFETVAGQFPERLCVRSSLEDFESSIRLPFERLKLAHTFAGREPRCATVSILWRNQSQLALHV